MEERKRDGRGGKEDEEKAWPGKSLPLLLTGTGQSEAGKGERIQAERDDVWRWLK